MFYRGIQSKFSSFLCGLGIAAIAGLTALPQEASAEAEVIKVPFNGLVFVPCANDGAGEPVAVQVTLHLVERDGAGPAEVGVWSGATGVGLITGGTYRGNIVSTAIPGSDEYLTTVSMQGMGPNGVHFTLTRIGELFMPPTEVLQAHCS